MIWALTETTNQFNSWKLEMDIFSAELKYNKKAQSFRITDGGDKRLFFIEKTGLLQNKFLIRTEYSVITGEVHPNGDGHSGVVVLENKKYHYLFKNNVLTFSSKKQFFPSIEMVNVDKTDQKEFFGLLFGTLRVIQKSYKMETAPALI